MFGRTTFGVVIANSQDLRHWRRLCERLGVEATEQESQRRDAVPCGTCDQCQRGHSCHSGTPPIRFYSASGLAVCLDAIKKSVSPVVTEIAYGECRVGMVGGGAGAEKKNPPYPKKLDFLTPRQRDKFLGNVAGKVRLPTKEIPIRGKDGVQLMGRDGPLTQVVSAVFESVSAPYEKAGKARREGK